MCHWDLRNRKTGIVSKCPVKGLHQFEGNSYCKRHFKALTTSTEKTNDVTDPKTNTQVATPEKSNSEVEPTPEKSNEEESNEKESTEESTEESTVEDSSKSEIEPEPEPEKLSYQQKKIINEVASTKEEPEEIPKSKKKKVKSEDTKVDPNADTQTSGLSVLKRNMLTVAVFRFFETLELVISQNILDITGTVDDLKKIKDARDALDEILDDLMPEGFLEQTFSPYERLLFFVVIAANGKYNENSYKKKIEILQAQLAQQQPQPPVEVDNNNVNPQSPRIPINLPS